MTMKLYSADLSPYATRVRIQARLKNLPLDILPPPMPLRTPEFHAKFPLGKIPILELEDGSYIYDSWVIMDYLEDIFPEHSLRPSEPVAKAEMQLLARYADTYLSPALFPLFRAMSAMPDDAGKQALVDGLKAELVKLDNLLTEQGGLDGRALHNGDIALAPNLFFAIALAPAFGEANILAGLDAVVAWWAAANAVPEIKQGIEEMTVALKAMTG